MSDTTTNLEIEDVLSSIRRLVSGEPAIDDASEQAEKFVLTPAYRVESGPAAHWPENIGSSADADDEDDSVKLTPDTRLPDAEAEEFVATFQHSKEPVIVDARDEAEDDWALDEFMVNDFNWEDGTDDEDIDAMFDRAAAILSDDPSEYEMVMRESGTILLNQRAKEMAVEFARAEGIDELGDEFNDDVEPVSDAAYLGRIGEEDEEANSVEFSADENDQTKEAAEAEVVDEVEDALSLDGADQANEGEEEASTEDADSAADLSAAFGFGSDDADVADEAEADIVDDEAELGVFAASYSEAEEDENLQELEASDGVEEVVVDEGPMVLTDAQSRQEEEPAEMTEDADVAPDLVGFTAPDYWAIDESASDDVADDEVAEVGLAEDVSEAAPLDLSAFAEDTEETDDEAEAPAEAEASSDILGFATGSDVEETAAQSEAAAPEPFLLGEAFKIDPEQDDQEAEALAEPEQVESSEDDSNTAELAADIFEEDAPEASDEDEPSEKTGPVFGTAYLRGRNWNFTDRMDEAEEKADAEASDLGGEADTEAVGEAEIAADEADALIAEFASSGEAETDAEAEAASEFDETTEESMDDAEVSIFEHSSDDEHSDAQQEEDVFLAAGDMLDEADLDDADEEALRILVKDIVREELQGETGELITRNLRRLIRKEINQALEIREMD